MVNLVVILSSVLHKEEMRNGGCTFPESGVETESGFGTPVSDFEDYLGVSEETSLKESVLDVFCLRKVNYRRRTFEPRFYRETFFCFV